jgi:hypothetical protein
MKSSWTISAASAGGLVSQLPDRTRLSWAREVMSSLMKTLRRWNWTVRGDRNSRVPISGLDRPSAASRAIWASCPVSSTRVVTARLRVVPPPAARSSRRPLGERLHPDLLQHLAGGAQLPAGVRGVALTVQPLPVQQVGAGERGSHPGPAP